MTLSTSHSIATAALHAWVSTITIFADDPYKTPSYLSLKTSKAHTALGSLKIMLTLHADDLDFWAQKLMHGFICDTELLLSDAEHTLNLHRFTGTLDFDTTSDSINLYRAKFPEISSRLIRQCV